MSTTNKIFLMLLFIYLFIYLLFINIGDHVIVKEDSTVMSTRSELYITMTTILELVLKSC